MEIWKDISGYEGLYKVSSLGNIRRCKKTYRCCLNTVRVLEEDIIVGDVNKGYKRVSLYKNGKHKRFMVHRLVAKAFIPNPEDRPEIDHINGISQDNRVENLKWVTHAENLNNPITRIRKSIAAMGNTHGSKHKDTRKEL